MRNRRNFFGKLTAGATGFLGLRRFVEAKTVFQDYENETEHYGDLIPDPAKLVDLPKDFSYKVISSKTIFLYLNFIQQDLWYVYDL